MNVVLRPPVMTRDEFLDWVQRQEGRYEFDGHGPVAMTGGTRKHGRIARNILVGLQTRFQSRRFEAIGADGGVATAAGSVRYPDVLVAAVEGADGDLLIPDVIVVFEVVSPSSERLDRFIKLREYQAVTSIRRYVIVEQESMAATVLSRAEGALSWTAHALIADDTLDMPEIGIAIPVRELYAGTTVPETLPDDGR